MIRQKLAVSAISTVILAVLVPLALAQKASPAGGTCPEFNGRNSFLILEAGKLVDTKVKNVTVEAWICLRSFPKEQERWVIAGKPGSFVLSIVGPAPDLPADLRDRPAGYSFEFCTDGQVPAGKVGNKWDGAVTWHESMELNNWYHVSASYDTPSGVVRLSIDGEFHATSGIPDTGNLVDTRSPFYIGGTKERKDSYFDGFIDEVRVSNAVRYKGDFKPPRGTFKADNQTLALWHFDKATGFFIDSSGNGNGLTGRNVGFLPVEPAGKLCTTWAKVRSEY